jgi:hypothetical protein
VPTSISATLRRTVDTVPRGSLARSHWDAEAPPTRVCPQPPGLGSGAGCKPNSHASRHSLGAT